jgi:predicted DNA-binding protein
MKGRNDLKNREPVNCAVEKGLNQKLIQLSKDTKIPKSKLLDEAIELLIKNRVK